MFVFHVISQILVNIKSAAYDHAKRQHRGVGDDIKRDHILDGMESEIITIYTDM